MSQTKEKIVMQKKTFFKDRFSLGLGDFLPSFSPLSAKPNENYVIECQGKYLITKILSDFVTIVWFTIEKVLTPGIELQSTAC